MIGEVNLFQVLVVQTEHVRAADRHKQRKNKMQHRTACNFKIDNTGNKKILLNPYKLKVL